MVKHIQTIRRQIVFPRYFSDMCIISIISQKQSLGGVLQKIFRKTPTIATSVLVKLQSDIHSFVKKGRHHRWFSSNFSKFLWKAFSQGTSRIFQIKFSLKYLQIICSYVTHTLYVGQLFSSSLITVLFGSWK